MEGATMLARRVRTQLVGDDVCWGMVFLKGMEVTLQLAIVVATEEVMDKGVEVVLTELSVGLSVGGADLEEGERSGWAAAGGTTAEGEGGVGRMALLSPPIISGLGVEMLM